MSVYQSAPTLEQAAITAKDFNFWYGDFHALTGLDLNIAKNAITSFIGPSGCGKSTFLRCINRMNDLIEGTRVEGTMTLDGNDIYAEGVDPVDLRRRVGMIFQQPNPFPKSIYENVAFGPRLQGVTSKSDLDDIVEESLKRANLWKEVSNQLNKDGLALSGGQQQRLCIARVLAVQPDVLLMDEPCSAIDPTSVSKVEDLMAELAHRVWSNRRDLHQSGGLADGRLYHRPLWLIGATSPKPIGSGPVRIHCAGGMTAPN